MKYRALHPPRCTPRSTALFVIVGACFMQMQIQMHDAGGEARAA